MNARSALQQALAVCRIWIQAQLTRRKGVYSEDDMIQGPSRAGGTRRYSFSDASGASWIGSVAGEVLVNMNLVCSQYCLSTEYASTTLKSSVQWTPSMYPAQTAVEISLLELTSPH